jgi:hypothetical protein
MEEGAAFSSYSFIEEGGKVSNKWLRMQEGWLKWNEGSIVTGGNEWICKRDSCKDDSTRRIVTKEWWRKKKDS